MFPSGWRRRAVVCSSAITLCLSGCMRAPEPTLRIGSEAFDQKAQQVEQRHETRLDPIPCEGRTTAPTSGEGWTSTFAGMKPPHWRSGDVGVTAKLSDGRLVWLFGDTTRDGTSRPRVVANSMLISRGSCFSEVRAPGNGPLIPSKSGSEACWPNSSMVLPAKKRDIIIVACSRIRRGSGKKPQEALYDFAYQGMSLALFTVGPNKAPTLVNVSEVVPDSPDQTRINWGSAMVGDQGWIYIYGSRQPKGSAGKAAYVARARVSQIGGIADWQYWTGSRFSDQADEARPLIPATEGVSQTFSVVPWRGEFLLVSKQGGEFGANVGVWKANHPYGPWSGAKAIPQPYSRGRGVVAYQPLAHPEIPTSDGSLIISMSRNTEQLADLFKDPVKGRPVFFDAQIP